MKSWATPKSIPALYTALADDAAEIRAAAVEALAGLGSAEAADALARGYDRQPPAVAEGLKKMGSVAEEAAQRLARHPSDRARSAACGVLATVGTAKSLPLLDKMAKDETGESAPGRPPSTPPEVIRSRGGAAVKNTPPE